MKIQIKRWLGEYEVTFADRNKVYVTVYLKKDSAVALAERLAALLKEDEG